MMSGKTPWKLISNTKRTKIKKANASKLKKQQYVYVLQPKADRQGSKIPFTEFRWMGPYIVEKALKITSIWYENLERTKPKSFIA